MEPGSAGTSHVDLVLSNADLAALDREGIQVELLRDAKGRTVAERAASQKKGGYKVFNDYDSKGGIAEQMRRIGQAVPEADQARDDRTLRPGPQDPGDAADPRVLPPEGDR